MKLCRLIGLFQRNRIPQFCSDGSLEFPIKGGIGSIYTFVVNCRIAQDCYNPDDSNNIQHHKNLEFIKEQNQWVYMELWEFIKI
jgi:hypothetical protein